jgi:hypothetical protein
MEMEGGHAGVLFRGGRERTIDPPDISPAGLMQGQRASNEMIEEFGLLLDEVTAMPEVQQLVDNDDVVADRLEHIIETALAPERPTVAQLREFIEYIEHILHILGPQ